MMHRANVSKYAQHLQSIADQQANALDQGEIGAGRRKRTAVAPSATGNVPSTASNRPAVPSEYSSPHQPGPSAGLSQNVNGSERAGRKAWEDFISGTLRSATNTGGVPTQNTSQEPSLPQVSQARDDVEMADKLDADDDDGDKDHEGDEDHDSGDDDVQGSTPQETAYLKRLKALYAKQSNKATEEALLAVLEKLSQEAAAEKSGCRKKHGRGRAGAGTPWDQTEEYICTDGPQRRERQRVALSGYIRLLLCQFLKLANKKAPLPPGPPPEVAALTPAAFYVKWNESEKSEFNATAARIVALQVLADYPSLCELDEIHDMVTCHLKYLRARYRRQTEPSYISKESERLRRCSSDTRKRTLYNHRLRIINAIPALARHGRLIETLGLEGTSSDEEDTTRVTRGVYIIKRRKQLSSQVNHLKRQLDLAYSIHFKGPGSKGNQLRRRIDTGAISGRRLKITGLPSSCMDPSWLSTLTDVQKDMYEFRNIQYDFTFPQELLESPDGV